MGHADALQTEENNLQAVQRILASATTPPLLQSNPLELIQSMRGEMEWGEAFSTHPIVSAASFHRSIVSILSIEQRLRHQDSRGRHGIRFVLNDI